MRISDCSSDVCSSDLGTGSRAIDVGVGHDYDAVIAQLVYVEVRPYAVTQSRDQGCDLFAGYQAVETRFFHVQHFAPQGQNSLELAVAALLGRAAGRVTLDDVNFAQGGLFFLAVGQLARQACTFKPDFTARHFTHFAGGLTT